MPNKTPKPSPTKTVRYRSADNGEYVKKEYADKHPNTTVKETDKKKK